MSKSYSHDHGWDFTNLREGDSMQTYAVVSCRRCRGIYRLKLGQNENRFHTQKAFAKVGWNVDLRNKNRAICPACIAQRKADRVFTVEPSEVREPEPMNEIKAPGEIFKALPVEAKTAIREMLDAHFDVAKGFYMHGYSDQRIGSECNVPWAAAAYIRDLMYGPLKTDPEIVAMRAELQAERDNIVRALDMMSKAETRIKVIEEKVDRISKRFASQ